MSTDPDTDAESLLWWQVGSLHIGVAFAAARLRFLNFAIGFRRLIALPTAIGVGFALLLGTCVGASVLIAADLAGGDFRDSVPLALMVGGGITTALVLPLLWPSDRSIGRRLFEAAEHLEELAGRYRVAKRALGRCRERTRRGRLPISTESQVQVVIDRLNGMFWSVSRLSDAATPALIAERGGVRLLTVIIPRFDAATPSDMRSAAGLQAELGCHAACVVSGRGFSRSAEAANFGMAMFDSENWFGFDPVVRRLFDKLRAESQAESAPDDGDYSADFNEPYSEHDQRDNNSAREAENGSRRADPTGNVLPAVFRTTFQLCGALAKLDGVVEATEVQAVVQSLDEYGLHGVAKAEARDAVKLGVAGQCSWRELGGRLAAQAGSCVELALACLAILERVAAADGRVCDAEAAALAELRELLGLPSAADETDSTPDDDTRQDDSTLDVDVECPFRVLGVPRPPCRDAIRVAYRRLQKEWHPDRVRNRGGSEEMVRIAELKSRRINWARDELHRLIELGTYEAGPTASSDADAGPRRSGSSKSSSAGSDSSHSSAGRHSSRQSGQGPGRTYAKSGAGKRSSGSKASQRRSKSSSRRSGSSQGSYHSQSYTDGSHSAWRGNDDRSYRSPDREQAATHWLTRKTGRRHNIHCRFYGRSDGRACGTSEGVACQSCGG